MKQTLKKKKCKNPNCENEFVGINSQQFCCCACRNSSQPRPKIKRKKKPTSTMDEVARKARELGISYGAYVAMQYKQERMKR